jgi:hypothetical protein
MDEITAAMLQNIREIEDRDENQILAELAGETISEYIYETEVWDWVPGPDGKRKKQKVRKVKLSWVGTREAARAKGNIVASDPIVTETDKDFRIVIKFTDLSRNFSVFGGCHQPKQMKVNDWGEEPGEIVGTHLEDDPFAFQKGLSKAQRNGLTACIPADWTAKMIDRFLAASRKGQKLPAGQRGRYIPQAGSSDTPVPARKTQIKPREEWEKITKDQVPDYPKLEQIMWDLAKIQPRDVYKELGGGSRNDMTIPAWDAFVTLKARFCPAEA